MTAEGRIPFSYLRAVGITSSLTNVAGDTEIPHGFKG